MFSKTFLISLLPLALAAPLESRDTGSSAFNMIATRSTSPIHLREISATNGGLYIGLESSAYCPSPPVPDCGSYSNATQIACASADGSATSCSMAVSVPGGQQLYVDPKTGKVGYTTPHSAMMPNGALTSGFTYTPAKQKGSVGSWGFCKGGAEGFSACPVKGKKNVWQVVADVKGVDVSKCLGMGVGTSETKAIAWEYGA